MTDPISNERLAEMLAGLEGVTPGPWRAYRHPQHAGQIQIGAGEIDGGGDGWDEWCVAATFEASEPGDLDANHIARCDPDTIRSLIEEVQASRRQSPAGVEPVLPCDVSLPPSTVIRAGCQLSTLHAALVARGMASPTKAVTITDEMVERAAEALWSSVSPSWAEAFSSPPSSHNGYRVVHLLRQARAAITAALSSEVNNGREVE